MKLSPILFPLFLLSALVRAEEAPRGARVLQMVSTNRTWDGQPIQYPAGSPQMTGGVITIPCGGETGWHLHPVPCLALLLEGEVTVEKRNGQKARLRAGDFLCETINTPHNGKNTGTVPAKFIVFYAGNTELTPTVPCP